MRCWGDDPWEKAKTMIRALAVVLALAAFAVTAPAFANCGAHQQSVSMPQPATTAGDEATKSKTSG